MSFNIKVIYFVLLSMCVAFTLLSCKSGGGTTDGREVAGINGPSKATETTEESTRYNATDLAIVTNIDTNKTTITFKSLNNNSVYDLTYSGGTRFKSKNGSELLISQIDLGEIVDVYYVAGGQKLIQMEESSSAFRNESVTNFSINYEHRKITIGNSQYVLDSNVVVKSDGRDITIEEITDVDELAVKGIGTNVKSILVKKGHGYVRLADETNFIGGLIELGDHVITEIQDDMVLVAPEGTYNLTATKGGTGGTKEITVKRDEEITVSLSEFQAAAKKYGAVKFNIGPDDAEALLYVDGNRTEYEAVVDLPYGKHYIKVTSNNYDDYEKYITVAALYTTINIDMSGEQETTTSTPETTSPSEETTTSGSSESETTTASDGTGSESGTTSNYMRKAGTYYNRVYVTTPLGAKVYLDGALQGTAAVGFAKPSGKHYILLMMDGYKSKVYTVEFDDSTEDILLSYPELETLSE